MKVLFRHKVKFACLVVLVYCQISRAQDLYSVLPLPFNGKFYDDFSAVPYKNGLVFCSNRTQNVFISRLDSLNRPLLDLYFVPKKTKEDWGTPMFFSKELNSKYHEGPVTFTNKQKTIYFTRNTPEVEGIFTADWNGTIWDNITPFQYNMQRSMTGHPCISADGKKLFFVSNRRGGQGGFDIYMCTRTGNRWNPPKNLGPEINSKYDELYPFYHSNGKLYFASNRKNGYGGLDIYFSMEINGKWIKPILLPPPINTRDDDFAFWSDSTDRHGYLSTDRTNRFKLSDVFEFTMNFPMFPDSLCKPIEKNSYTYEFFEQSAINTDTTTFLYEWGFGDGSKVRGKSLDVVHTFAKTGDYLVQLNVIDTLTDSVYLNQASNLFPVRDVEQPYITCPDSAFVNADIMFDANKTYLPDKKTTNYYWDFSDGLIAVGAEVKHKFEEPGRYKVKLGVAVVDENQKATVLYRYKVIIIKKKPPS